MDLNSFYRHLSFKRWSRVLAFVCAFIACAVIAYYFFIRQVTHRQTEWNFKNVSNLHSGELELEPDRIYEISWEEKESVPVELFVDSVYAHTLNYYNDYPNRGGYLNHTVYTYLSNPARIKVNKPTIFGIVFKRHTRFTFNESWGEFWDKWFTSLSDPVATVHWKVKDITDERISSTDLLIDGQFNIVRR
jgi:hypothetical protein